MIVDVHHHYVSHPATMDEKTLFNWTRTLAAGVPYSHAGGARSEGVGVPIEVLQKRLAECYPDPNGEKLLARMAKAGIDFTVAFPLDNIARLADNDAVLALNRSCAEMAKHSNDKIIPFASVDPRRKAAPELFRRCIEEYGMKGLKWHPDLGYWPNDEAGYAVLKVAEELKVPLLTHTGPISDSRSPGNASPPIFRAKYANAMLLDDICLDFPNLKVIAAHMGGPHSWREWAALAQYRPNLYGDLAMWQFPAVTHYDRFCRDLREILDIAGTDAVMLGTDDPFNSAAVPSRDFVRILQDLPEKAPAGIKFTTEEIEAILGGNARHVFGL